MVFRVTQTLENPTMPQIYHHLHRAMETTPLVEWLHWASVALPGCFLAPVMSIYHIFEEEHTHNKNK